MPIKPEGTLVLRSFIMKCVIIFLSLLAVGYSSYLVPRLNLRTINIVVGDDGTITIETTAGTRLFITRNLEHSGPRNIEVFLEDATTPMKKIWIDREATIQLIDSHFWGGMTEADILVRIFKNWQGPLDITSYNALLERVSVCVQNGHINVVLLKILRCLNVEYVSLERCVLDSTLLNTVRPRWSSVLNRLGMRIPVQQRMLNDMSGVQMLDDDMTVGSVIREPRNILGQEEYMMRKFDPSTVTMVESVPDRIPLMDMIHSVPEESMMYRQNPLMRMMQYTPEETMVGRQDLMMPLIESVPENNMVYRQGPLMRRMVRSAPDDIMFV
ncbi:unnamed protein product [Phaedon cochleariae]|uniref:Uncharacterized protein n=1 Tax=Phaedon cochleariae TaxID=80249 RepID=A0A9P0GR86_PHACE|nr:unnamed protein product [Phaedon cochleariae]